MLLCVKTIKEKKKCDKHNLMPGNINILNYFLTTRAVKCHLYIFLVFLLSSYKHTFPVSLCT